MLLLLMIKFFFILSYNFAVFSFERKSDNTKKKTKKNLIKTSFEKLIFKTQFYFVLTEFF